MQLDDIYEIEILDVAYGGYSVGKFNNFTIFVDSIAIPSDIVQVKIKEIKKNFAVGTIEKFIFLSPYRIECRCNYFLDGCGGCNWIHVNYEKQLEWKKNLVKSLLKRIGKIDIDVTDIIRSENCYNYRNKMTLHSNERKVGFFKRKSFDVIHIDYCYQQISYNNDVLQEYKKNFQEFEKIKIRSNFAGHTVINLKTENPFTEKIYKLNNFFTTKELFGVCINGRAIYGQPYIEQNIKDILFRIPITSFFQVNYYIAEKIIEKVVEIVSKNKRKIVFDLYCGVGLFSLFLSKYSEYVVAVDSDNHAINYAKLNAKINKIDNINFYTSDSYSFFKKTNYRPIDIILIDPPREGCEKELLLDIIKEKIPEIIYISCGLDTLARDLFLLCQNGYKIKYILPFDMFPHTYHVETLVYLTV